MSIENILKDFYKHTTGVDDFGCKHCKKYLALIKSEVEGIINNLPSEYLVKEGKEGRVIWKSQTLSVLSKLFKHLTLLSILLSVICFP
jgi:hypothetical protein